MLESLGTMLDLGIVIVNWNTRDLLRDCLNSVLRSKGVYVSAWWWSITPRRMAAPRWCSANFPDVMVIANTDNVGYPAGE